MDITPFVSIDREQLLEIFYGLNDEVDVYHLIDGQQVEHFRSGDSVAFSERTIKHRQPIFPIHASDHYQIQGKHEIYTRIVSQGSTKFPVQLWDKKSFYKQDEILVLIRGGLIGAAAVMVIYNLFLFAITRKVSALFYVAFMVSVAFAMLHVEGYTFQYLWPDTPALNNAGIIVFLGIAYMLTVCFSYTFLSLKYAKPWVRHSGKAIVAFVALWVLLAPFVPYESIILPFFMTVAIVNLYNPFVGIYQWRKGMREARFFCLAWMMVIIGTLVSQLSYAGVLPFGLLATEGVTIGLMVQMALHSLAFGDQYKEEKSARQKAQSAQDAKGQFMAKMSHEIRTPMNGIIGLAELLSFTALKSQQKYYVDSIQYSGQSMMALINDVLDLSKIEVGKMDLEVMSVNLETLTRECLDSIRDEAKKRSIDLVLQFDESLSIYVLADESRITQVLKNFISNAIKYSSDNTVELRVTPKLKGVDGVEVLFEVVDRGDGIPLERMPYLFEPMVQLGLSGEDVFGGGGLGLTLSKELVSLMDGKIGARNNSGKGATFWCSLPLVISDEFVEAYSEESYAENSLAGSTETVAELSDEITVLVADDNKVNLMVVKGVLDRLGCKVITAENGLQAVDLYEDTATKVDLILMDCEMPDMDGFEATEYIRLYEGRVGSPRVPIVALSAHVMGDIASQCRDVGMDDLISKPVTIDGIDQLLANFFPQFGQLDTEIA